MSNWYWSRSTPQPAPGELATAYVPVRVQGAAPDGSADVFKQIPLPGVTTVTFDAVVGALTFTPANKGGETFGGAVIGPLLAARNGPNGRVELAYGDASNSGALVFRGGAGTYMGSVYRVNSGAITYDSQGGGHTFDASVTVGGALTSGMVVVKNGANGRVALAAGDATNSGALEFFDGTGTYLGAINRQSSGKIVYDSQGGGHYFDGSITTPGGLAVGGSASFAQTVSVSTTSGGAALILSAPSGQSKLLRLQTGATAGWDFGMNAAGDLIASRYGSGSFIDIPFSVSSSSGLVTLGKARTTGDLTVGNTNNLIVEGGYFNLTGNQALPVNPIGNPAQTTLVSSLMQAQTVSANANQREFFNYSGVNVLHGYDADDATRAQRDKVVRYDSCVALTGCANVWTYNPLMSLQSTNMVDCQLIEADLNNLSGNHYGDTLGPAGLGPFTCTGMSMVGAGNYRSTQAFVVGHSGAGWNRGFVSANGVNQVDFTSYSVATYFLQDWSGSSGRVDGLHTVNATYSGSAIHLGNNQRIDSRNAANTARITIAHVDTSNNLHLGETNTGGNLASNVYVGAPFLPRVDNSITLGGGSNRWASIWSATGTIQTSDPSTKTDIQPLADGMGAIVDRIEPRSYRFKVGGMEPVTTTVRETVQETDADGTPLFDIVAAEPDPTAHRLHQSKTERVPRMVEKDVEHTEYVEREGRRTHYGFLSTDFADLDFGGFVKDADSGLEGLRSDELVAILWAALRETRARLSALEAKR